MTYKIAVLGGDGIGVEVTEQSVRVLDKIASISDMDFEYEYYLVGGASIDKYGIPLRPEDFEKIAKCDNVLLGAVGGTKWDNLPSEIRPEQALFKLRGGLQLFANLRPIILFDELSDECLLKKGVGNGLDILIIRELTGGIYFGKKWRDGDTAHDTMTYSVSEVERIVKVAIEMAKLRKNNIISVDKANVLESSRLWREVFEGMMSKTCGIEYSNLLVDNAAMQLIRNPKMFDVMVTSNLFGDILSDEASMLTGSIGMLPSASLGDGSKGMYEPVHGSAPDIAGRGIANPIASILSVGMMLRYSFKRIELADKVDNAVKSALKQGARCADLVTNTPLSTKEMGDVILSYIV